MYVEFDAMPDSARIWIYQSNKELNAEQKEAIEKRLVEFIEQWTRHGDDLKGSFAIKYDHFIVLAVDESYQGVSGCSIDASTHVFQEFERAFGLDLMNKLNTAFRDGPHLNVVPLSVFQSFVKENKVGPSTIVFNNMVEDKKGLLTQWEVPAEESWHKRYFR